MIPRKILFKNVEILCTDEDVKILSSLLEDPVNFEFKVSFLPILETDEEGLIKIFRPLTMSMGLLFYIQNLMITQRLYFLDEFIKEHRLVK